MFGRDYHDYKVGILHNIKYRVSKGYQTNNLKSLWNICKYVQWLFEKQILIT